MINYSFDTQIRTHVTCALAVIASAIAANADKFISMVPIEIATPSAFALFGVLHFIFDRYVWKFFPFKKVLGVPDLNGKWSGRLDRTNIKTEERETQIPICVNICQTWTRINISVENHVEASFSKKTRSDARVATLEIEDKDSIVLKHIWEHDKAKGFSELKLSLDKNSRPCLSGYYTSTAGREGYITIFKEN